MSSVDQLAQAKRPFLTDGGFETSLFFIDGFEAPEFAAIVLLDDAEARRAKRRYFDRFLAMAESARTGFVLDTSTWRGCVDWADKLGVTREKLLQLSADAVVFAQEIRAAWRDRVSPILINGVVGPMGDGYDATGAPKADRAFEAHMPQMRVMVDAGVDMLSAITMTNTPETIGIVRAAVELQKPIVPSFTVETDGRLPTGETLEEAIVKTDEATGGAPLYYMVNCAHPEHFRDALKAGANWVSRIGGVRANASRLSHAELDVAETLDDGDPEEFGRLYAELSQVLPNLRVIGGCCGTDHRHVACASHHLHAQAAA